MCFSFARFCAQRRFFLCENRAAPHSTALRHIVRVFPCHGGVLTTHKSRLSMTRKAWQQIIQKQKIITKSKLQDIPKHRQTSPKQSKRPISNFCKLVGLGSDCAAGTADQGTEELVETEALLKGASQDRTDRMLGDSNRTCLDVSSAAVWSGQVRCRTRIKSLVMPLVQCFQSNEKQISVFTDF